MAVIGDAADVVSVDASGVVGGPGGRTVAVVGLDDVVVIDTPDALLVVARDRAQDVKAVVDRLKASGRDRPHLSRPTSAPELAADVPPAERRLRQDHEAARRSTTSTTRGIATTPDPGSTTAWTNGDRSTTGCGRLNSGPNSPTTTNAASSAHAT